VSRRRRPDSGRILVRGGKRLTKAGLDLGCKMLLDLIKQTKSRIPNE
jgi:hypothetical protein